MSRLIDADAFDKTLEDAELEAKRNRKNVFASALNIIRGNLRNAPTIEERKSGKWIVKRSGVQGLGDIYICPFCKHEVDCTPENFCGNCGARMKS